MDHDSIKECLHSNFNDFKLLYKTLSDEIETEIEASRSLNQKVSENLTLTPGGGKEET